MIDSLLNPEYDIMDLLVRYMEYTNRSYGNFYHIGAVKKGKKFHSSRTSFLLCFKANLIQSTRILNKINQQLKLMVLVKTDLNEMKAISNIINYWK